MRLTGTCALDRKGLPERVPIEFDTSEQTIAVWLPLPPIEKYFTAGQHFTGKSLPITDIRVVSPTAQLSCKRLPSAFVSSFGASGYSLDDGEINKVIAVEEDRIQAIRLNLTLHRSKITFTVTPFAPAVRIRPETMYTNHSSHQHQQFDVVLGKRKLGVRYSPKHVFVRGRTSAKDREILRHTLSLLSLGPEQEVTNLAPPRLTMNCSWSTAKAYGEPVLKADGLPAAFQSIIAHLVGCPTAQKERHFNEILHTVAGFQQAVFVEHRLTNLLKALESFDGTRTMAANRLASLLQIEIGDAKFVCGIRNDLIHKGIPLVEAAFNVHADLVGKGVKLKRFRSLPKTQSLPWRVHITIARLIVAALFRQFGVTTTKTLYARMKGF